MSFFHKVFARAHTPCGGIPQATVRTPMRIEAKNPQPRCVIRFRESSRKNCSGARLSRAEIAKIHHRMDTQCCKRASETGRQKGLANWGAQ